MSAYYDSMRRRALDSGATPPEAQPVTPLMTPVSSRASTPVAMPPSAPLAPPTVPVTIAAPPSDAGAFEGLREQLAARGNGKALQTLVFTGCSGAEGCSGFVRAFARSLATAGSRVLVIDLARAFAGDVGTELAEAVRSAVPFPSEPIGRGRAGECGTAAAHGEREALLRSSAFAAWLATQRTAFDYVLFATPPAVRFADALLVGRRSDGVVLLVQSEGTERSALTRTRDHLERAGVPIVGAVLDGVRTEVPSLVRRYFGED